MTDVVSKVSLISTAAVLLGEKPIMSLSDNRFSATVGAAIFDTILTNELQTNRWRFSVNKKTLNQLTAAPLNEYQYAYQLPSDMILPIGTWPAMNYEIYGDQLYTNESRVDLEYQYQPPLQKMPAYFTLLLTYALAKDMVNPVTEGGNDKIEIFTKKYLMQRNLAQFADAQGRPNRTALYAPFLAVR
jgi:hypothetical protein